MICLDWDINVANLISERNLLIIEEKNFLAS